LSFGKKKATVKHIATEAACNITVKRTKGSDGKISCKYRTIQLANQVGHIGEPGKDYVHQEGTLNFEHNITEQVIKIEILQHAAVEGADEDEIVDRDEVFGLQIYEATPDAVKISKKDTCVIELVTDADAKKQAEALQALLDRINREEEVTWSQQFINACLLHPTKNDDGEIEDIGCFDAFLQFFAIGWKVFFSLVPPPHYCKGWGCFVVALAMIGLCTGIVGEIANLMGCVIGLKPGVTAITFVAIGTSLPDTFASKKAAIDERYADAAIGNINGSNCVNVFLGLGLPWVMGSIYYTNRGEKFKVPSKGLDVSVALFLCTAFFAVALMVIRRCLLKGELGGGKCGRTASAIFLVFLWVLYIVMSSLV